MLLVTLLIMARERLYGEIAGFPEGHAFPDREALRLAGVHRPGQSGISGGKDGADSIVVSGGYPDDEDYGDVIIYTGQGGQDANGRQVADQELVRGNIGLVRSQLDERDVRVIRGAKGDPKFSPATGYRYDGLYRVIDHWHDDSRDGPRIWRFRLVKVVPSQPAEMEDTSGPAPRVNFSGDRVVRDAQVAKRVKQFHDHLCQICNVQLMTGGGPHAEGAHIRGLGRPHNGPDDESNMLCLCPNHHVLFDTGTIYIDDGWSIWDALSQKIIGSLRRVPEHNINIEYVRYHRNHHRLQ